MKVAGDKGVGVTNFFVIYLEPEKISGETGGVVKILVTQMTPTPPPLPPPNNKLLLPYGRLKINEILLKGRKTHNKNK